MVSKGVNQERGMTIIEITIVVLLISVVTAFAIPGIGNAMRRYRMSIAQRNLADMVNRAKMRAVAESRRAGVVVDTAGSRLGLAVYNDDNSLNRIDYIPLPQGVSFQRPDSGGNPEGTSGTEAISFDLQDGVNVLNFNSRGMPMVATFGESNWVFVGDGDHFCAVVINTVGGIRHWEMEEGQWTARDGQESSESSGGSSEDEGGDTGHGQGQGHGR